MISNEAVDAAGEYLRPVYTSNEVYRADLIKALEAAAPHILAKALEDLSETRIGDDEKSLFTWGQRDWLASEAKRIRTVP